MDIQVHALLTAVVEAFEWKHPAENPVGKLRGQRVVIYPPELDRLQSVLSTDKSQWDVAHWQEEACERIVSARDSFEHLPLFFTSDQEELKNHVDLSKIDEWMSTASQIATGGRRQVPEDGPDVINSESDSDNEQHGDQLTGAYIGTETDSNGDPKGSTPRMENSYADLVRLQARGASSTVSTSCPQAPPPAPPPVQERKVTPLNSDDDAQPLLYDQEREIGHAKKMDRAQLEKSSQISEGSHGMTTRSQAKKARGAGSLRPAVGSGKTDTRVAKGHPSKT
jgi:hypothetical protein